MQPIIYTVHAGVLYHSQKWGSRIAYERRKRGVQLQHGVLDQASGQYCLWIALVIFEVLTVQQVYDLRSALRSRLGQVWRKSVLSLEQGIDANQMESLLNSLKHAVNYQKVNGTSLNIALFAASRIPLSELVLVYGVDSRTEDCHWLLVVGIEELYNDTLRGAWHCRALLCLDPSQEGSSLVPYNAKIERHFSRKRQRLEYIAHGQRKRMELLCAYALQRVPDNKPTDLQTADVGSDANSSFDSPPQR